MAFHEKAGRSQVNSRLVLLNKLFSPDELATVAMFHSHSQGVIRFARRRLGVLGSASASICLAPRDQMVIMEIR